MLISILPQNRGADTFRDSNDHRHRLIPGQAARFAAMAYDILQQKISPYRAIHDIHNREFIRRKHFHTRQSCHHQPPFRNKSTNPDTAYPPCITNSGQTVNDSAVSLLWFFCNDWTKHTGDMRLPCGFIPAHCVPVGLLLPTLLNEFFSRQDFHR